MQSNAAWGAPPYWRRYTEGWSNPCGVHPGEAGLNGWSRVTASQRMVRQLKGAAQCTGPRGWSTRPWHACAEWVAAIGLAARPSSKTYCTKIERWIPSGKPAHGCACSTGIRSSKGGKAGTQAVGTRCVKHDVACGQAVFCRVAWLPPIKCGDRICADVEHVCVRAQFAILTWHLGRLMSVGERRPCTCSAGGATCQPGHMPCL